MFSLGVTNSVIIFEVRFTLNHIDGRHAIQGEYCRPFARVYKSIGFVTYYSNLCCKRARG